MTYPKPGEILLTDPQTGGVLREQFEHVGANEHYVSCAMFEDDDHNVIREKIKFPWHRVVAVQHELETDDDGRRVYVDPTEDSDE